MLAGLLVVLALAGCRPPAGERVYEHEAFTFVIPAGWKTTEEVWGDSASTRREYYGLGVQEVVTLQYPAGRGRGEAFFAVASAPLAEGGVWGPGWPGPTRGRSPKSGTPSSGPLIWGSHQGTR